MFDLFFADMNNYDQQNNNYHQNNNNYQESQNQINHLQRELIQQLQINLEQERRNQ